MPELRPYRPGDEQGICELFAATHGRPLPLELWRWRYGTKSIINVAADAGRIVGHVGALPVRLTRGAESVAAGLWVDLMVHPDYRNLGLFLDMAEANHRLCAENGVRLVFAFPNDRSYPILKRMLGWNAIEEIDALEAPLSALAAAGSGAAPLSAFGAEHAALWRRLAPADAFAPERTPDFLKWRYRERPGRTYFAWEARDAKGALRGWLAANVFDGPQGKIGDVLDLCAEPDAADAVWSAASAHFRSNGVRTVSAWALKGGPDFARYVAWGLTPNGPRTHFAGRWTSPEEKAPFPSQGPDWFVSKGDSDVF